MEARSATARGGLWVQVPDPLDPHDRGAATRPRAAAMRPIRVIATLLLSASASGHAAVERLSEESIALLSLRGRRGRGRRERGISQHAVAAGLTGLGARFGGSRRARRACGSARAARGPRRRCFTARPRRFRSSSLRPWSREVRGAFREAPSLVVVADQGADALSTFDVLGVDAIHVVGPAPGRERFPLAAFLDARGQRPSGRCAGGRHSRRRDPAQALTVESAMRIGMVLDYDGTDYHGWQVQPDRPTVQGVLEEALATILGERVRLDAAGRTDAGVHARGQVAAFSTLRAVDCPRLQRGLNALCGPGSSRERVGPVAADFDPRRDARSRRYEYRIRQRTVAVSVHAAPCLARTLPARRRCDGRKRPRRSSANTISAPFKPRTATPRIRSGRSSRAAMIRRAGRYRLPIDATAFLRHMVRTSWDAGRGGKRGAVGSATSARC